jgi:hypothetical protein
MNDQPARMFLLTYGDPATGRTEWVRDDDPRIASAVQESRVAVKVAEHPVSRTRRLLDWLRALG